MSRIEELEQQAKTILEEIEKLKKEEKVWKPKKNKAYHYILSYGEVDADNWGDDVADFDRYAIGNCFKTKKEAEKALEKLEIYTQLKRLAEEENTEPIDWENYNQSKFFIGYSHYNKEFLQNTNLACEEAGTIYSTNKDFLEIAQLRIGEEKLLKLFKE